MYWSRKPEMPATTTFVSTTARCFRFLAFGCNGDLRHAPFRAISCESCVGSPLRKSLLYPWPHRIALRGTPSSSRRAFARAAGRGRGPPCSCPVQSCSPSDRNGTPSLIGSSSREKRQVKTTYSGFFATKTFLGGAKDIDEPGENVGACSQGFLQTKRHLCCEKRLSVKEIGAIHPLRLDHAKLHEVLQFFRLDLQNRACLLQFQRRCGISPPLLSKY